MPFNLTPNNSGTATGYYASQSDVENVFGVENIARWSQLDNNILTANTVRIGIGLALTDQRINDYFLNSRVNIPLPVYPPTTHWSAVLTGAWLVKSRPIGSDSNSFEWVCLLEKEILREMGQYKTGIYQFPSTTQILSNVPSCPVTVTV